MPGLPRVRHRRYRDNFRVPHRPYLSLRANRTHRYLMRDLDERIELTIPHHWVVYLKPLAIAIGGCLVLGVAMDMPRQDREVPTFLAFGVLSYAIYEYLLRYLDVVVVTNLRVLRLRGIFDSFRATMPLSRILDITIYKPGTGRLLGFGHMTFETAAQQQGLKDIRYVGKVDERERLIQNLVYEHDPRRERMLKQRRVRTEPRLDREDTQTLTED